MTAAYHRSGCGRLAGTGLLTAALPLHACAAGITGGYLDYLGTDTVIVAIFLANSLLLLGFLIRFKKLSGSLLKTATVLEDQEENARFVADNLPRITLFRLECPPEGIFAFRYISEGFKEVLGIDRERVMNDAKLVFDHVHREDIPLLREAYERARKTLEPADLNLRMLDINGNLRWLNISAVPRAEQETIVWEGMLRDITEDKKLEAALIEEKRSFQNLFETIDDLMLICDMDGRLLHTNPAVEQRLEYPADELKEMTLFELYPAHLRPEIYRIIAGIRSEKSAHSSLPFHTRSGNPIPVDMRYFRGSWKNRKAVFGIARDAAHRHQTETALRESQQMLQLIMDTIPMSVFWKDTHSECLGGNKTFIGECGIDDVADVIGKKPHELFDEETAAALVAHDLQVVTTNKPMLNMLMPFSHTDGTLGQHEVSKIPLHNETGKVVGVLEIWRDITEQNQSEERLKRTLEDMERFNQLMRGRELRTLELKTEVNQLLEELGREIKYNTTSDGLT